MFGSIIICTTFNAICSKGDRLPVQTHPAHAVLTLDKNDTPSSADCESGKPMSALARETTMQPVAHLDLVGVVILCLAYSFHGLLVLQNFLPGLIHLFPDALLAMTRSIELRDKLSPLGSLD